MTVRPLLLACALFTGSASGVQEPRLAPPPLAEPPPPGDAPPEALPQLVVPEPIEQAPALGRGVVLLHLEAPAGILLKREAGPPVKVFDASGVRLSMGPICAAPCDVIIEARGADRFVFGGGDNTPESAAFDLGELGGVVTARVSPGNKGLRALAAVSVGLGLTSEYLAYVELLSDPNQINPSGLSPPRHGARNFAVAGVGLMVTGVVLYFLSRTTYVLEPAPGR
jgi:hypothetical protein